MANNRPSVAIVQSYVPQYRADFFDGLRSKLNDCGINVHLLLTQPSAIQRLRNDAVELEWARHVPCRRLSVAGRTVLLPSQILQQSPDLVISEQALANGLIWRSAMHWPNRPKFALWGHGRIMTRAARNSEQRLLMHLTRRADWFFGYTSASVDYVVSHGFPVNKTTNVQNAVNTEPLLHSDTRGEAAIRRANSDTLLYIGGLDTSKGVLEMLDAAELTASRVPSFRLIVAGDGALRGQVERRLERSPWLTYVGPVYDPAHKVKLAADAIALVQPRRIGLAIVEAFALGLPILATDYPLSAPESAYLQVGTNGLVSKMDADSMADCWVAYIQDRKVQARLAAGAVRSGESLTIKNMITSFAAGVEKILR